MLDPPLIKTPLPRLLILNTFAGPPLPSTYLALKSMFVARMGLPCRHILQSCAYVDMPLFDAELGNKRWTGDYYQTLSQVRFTLPSWNDGDEKSDVSMSEISSESKKAILTQAQKYGNVLKITNPLASVGSEHGIKLCNKRVQMLQKNLENW